VRRKSNKEGEQLRMITPAARVARDREEELRAFSRDYIN
jgi:hypothetical protein